MTEIDFGPQYRAAQTELDRRVKTELWKRGELSWKLHDAQKKLDETYTQIKHTLFVGNCSRQWGKSFWALTKAIELAIQKPRAQIRYGAAFETDLTEFIIPAIEFIIEDAPDSVKPVQRGSSFIFPNKSRIKLVGLDKKPNGLRGNTLDMIIIDECGFVSNLDYIYRSIIIPSTLHRPNCKIIFISTPPSTPAHPFVEFAQRAEIEGAYAIFDIYTNPLITQADIDRMAKEMSADGQTIDYTTTTFRRECLCEFILDDDSALCSEWRDIYIQELPRDEFYQYYHKYDGMDLGRKHFTAIIYGYYDFKRAALVCEDELTMEGKKWTTQTLNTDIKRKENALWGNWSEWDEKKKDFTVQKRDPNNEQIPYRRISDNNNPHLIMDLGQLHGLYFAETTKESLEAMVNEVRLMAGAGQIIVSPKCKKLIGCLKYGIWDSKRKEFAENKVYGHFDHFAALMYLVRNLNKTTNPIPATHGHENHRSWLGHVNKQQASANAKEIAKSIIPNASSINTSLRKRGFK